MPYCMYLRKSRADLDAETRGEGETLARHERILLELAKKLKLSITNIYKEIVSGETISSRPVMQQLLSDVEQGLWDGVLVMEVERLARGDTIDQGLVAQTFKYSSTKIITPVKTYDPNNEYDEEYFEFGLFMSRREYKTINRRLQSGRIASVKEGKYLGTRPPYGYVRKKLEKEKGYTLEPNPDQANIVRMIYALYTDRIGVSLIVRKLNELKVKPMRSDSWVPASILDILRNPVYIGKIRWNSRPTKKRMVDGQIKKERPRAAHGDYILVDGLHDAIVDTQTWDRAQEYLSINPSTPTPNRYTVKNPLSGLIVCSKCGRKMIRRPYSSGYPDTLMCPATSCNNVSSPLLLVENNLLLAIEKWLENYKIKVGSKDSPEKQDAQVSVKKKAVKKMEEEITTLEKQKDNLHDLLEQKVYSTEKFLDRSKSISERISEAQSEKALLVKDIENDMIMDEGRKKIIPKIEGVLGIYHSTTDPKIKNDLLKEVIEKVVYTKEEGGRWNPRTNDFQLDLYPRLPRG